MNDITEVPDQVRAFAPLNERRRQSKVFAEASDHYIRLTEQMEHLEQRLQDTCNELEVKNKQVEFLKDEVRRLTQLNDIHAQNHASLEAGLLAVKDILMAVDLRNKARVQDTTG